MRDPDRIPQVLGALRQAWLSTPDQRFGQLIENIATIDHPGYPPRSSIWHMEENEWMDRINTWTAAHPHPSAPRPPIQVPPLGDARPASMFRTPGFSTED